MALPKTYYQRLQSQTNINQPQEINDDAYEYARSQLVPDQDAEDKGNLYDSIGEFLWKAGEGYGAGITFGASELAYDSDEWADMSSTEKAGWVVGEGLGMVTPGIGPFALLGNTARAIPKVLGANQFIRKGVQEAVEKGLEAPQIATKLRKANISQDATKKAFQEGLTKDVAESKIATSLIQNLSATGKAGVQAQSQLTELSTKTLLNNASKIGLKNLTENDARIISKAYVKGLREGNYVNDVSEWLGRSLSRSGIPLASSERISRYLGMATQDIAIMGMHGLASAKINAMAHDYEFGINEIKDQAKFTTMMGLSFPIIRSFGKGGINNLEKGFRVYLDAFRNTNYNKILAEKGEAPVRGLLKLMLSGEYKNASSRSLLKSATWSSNGRKYTGNELLSKANSMPIDDVVNVLKQMKKVTTRNQISKWNQDYLLDLYQSIPRMALGMTVGNAWMFTKDAMGNLPFQYMDSPEFWSHILMSANMTKHKGAYGKAEERAYFQDMKKYQDALRLLNVDVNNINNVIKFHDSTKMTQGYGASIRTHYVGREIQRAVNEALTNTKDEPSDIKQGYDYADHEGLDGLVQIYNLMEYSKDSQFTPINIRNLSKKKIDAIKERLYGIKFDDGTTIGELSPERALQKLTLETSEGMTQIYRDMLSELSKIGYDVGFDERTGKRGSARRVESSEIGQSMGSGTDLYNRIIDAMTDLGVVSRTDGSTNYKEMIKRSAYNAELPRITDEKSFQRETNRIIKDHLQRLGAEYGDNKIDFDPIDNPFFRTMVDSKRMESTEKLMNIITNSHKNPNSTESNITTTLDNIFKMPDGKYLQNFGDYVKKIDGFDENTESGKAILQNLDMLRPLFNLRRMVLGTSKNEIESKKGSIDSEAIATMLKQFEDFQSTDLFQAGDYESEITNAWVTRTLKGKKVDRRGIGLVIKLRDMNAGIIEDGKILIPSEKLIEQEYRRRVGDNTDDETLEQLKTSVRTMKEVLGDNAKVMTDIVPTEDYSSLKEIVDLEDYINAYKYLGNESYKDLLTNTQEIIKGLHQDSRMNGLLKNIDSKVDDLRKVFTDDELRTTEDPIKEVNEVLEDLITVEKMLGKGAEDSETQNNISLLRENIKRMETLGKRFSASDNLVTPEIENKIINEIEQVNTSVTQVVAAMIDNNNRGIRDIQDIVIKLQNLSNKQSDQGLSVSQVQQITESLSRQLYTKHKNLENTETKLLSELIEDVNRSGSFSEAREIFRSVNDEINKALLLENPNYLASDVQQDLRALNSENKIHETHRTVVDILGDYDLLDANGKLKRQFHEAFSKDPIKAIETVLKDKIYSSEKTKDQQDSEWNKFKDKDAFELINYLENLREQKRISFRLMSDGKIGLIDISNNQPSIDKPSTRYFDENNMSVALITETIPVDINGRLRNQSIDQINDPLLIHQSLNNSIRENLQNQNELLKKLTVLDGELTESDIQNHENSVDRDLLYYVRLSPQNRLAFSGSKANMEKMNLKFNNWYESFKKKLNPKGKEQFDSILELVRNGAETRANVELKVLLPYLDHNGTRGELIKLFNAYGSGESEATIAKLQMNLFKRGSLVDGGTTQRMSRAGVEWMSKNHSSRNVQKFAKRVLKNNGYRTGLIADESIEDLSNKKRVQDKLDILEKDTTLDPIVNKLAKLQKESLGDLESLNSSVMDGAIYVSKEMMEFVMASKGMLNTDLSDSPNGAKPIIFSVGDNQLLGKGYLVYDPNAVLPTGSDIVIGESSAKAFHGKNIQGTNIKISEDMTFTNKNIMNVPMDALGISWTSKNTDGVVISPSTFDWQNANTIKHAIKWMKLENKIALINTTWSNVSKDVGISDLLYQINKEAGNPMDKGDAGLTKALFSYGAKANNPLISSALRLMLRNNTYKNLRSPKALNSGEDNISIPDLNNELDVPLYVELNDSDGNLRKRISYTYGGITLNRNTTKRLMGLSKPNQTSASLQNEKFIYRTPLGYDVSVEVSVDKKGNVELKKFSSFEDSIEGKKRFTKDNEEIKKIDKTTEKQIENELKIFFKELHEQVGKGNHNFRETHWLMNDYNYNRNNIKTQLSPEAIAIKNKYNIELGMYSHAIPVIGHDKVINRVQQIKDGMDGLVALNVLDLRTVMQRDNDGDHIYNHTQSDFEIYKAFARENGMKDDFRMFDTQETMGDNYINFLGISNGKAGQDSKNSGFQNYASKLHKSKRLVGTLIGTRNALSWLSNLGFSQTNGELKIANLTDIKDMGSEAWKLADKFYDLAQNSVDVHGGILDLMTDPRVVENFILYGEIPLDLKARFENNEITDPILQKHIEGGGLFAKGIMDETGKKSTFMQKQAVKEILKTLKKVKMLDNDVYDDAGSRSPQPREIRDAYWDIYNLFSDPTRYLAKRLIRQASRSGANRESRINEILELFYPDESYPRNKAELAWNLIKNADSNSLPPIKEIFKFDNVTKNDPESILEAFDLNVPGSVMKRLAGSDFLKDPNYEGFGSNKKLFDMSGSFIKDVEASVELSRIFGTNPVDDFTMQLYDSDSKRLKIKTYNEINGLNEAIKNGLIRSVMNRQYSQLMKSIEFYNGEKFTNPAKMQNLKNRLANMQDAINIMDNLIAKNMVIEPEAGIIKGNDNILNFNKMNIGKNKKVALYRIKGDIKPLSKEPNVLGDYKVNDQNLDYGQLEFQGYFDSKSKGFRLFKNYTYIVDKKPRIKVSLSKAENKYNLALFKATYGSDIKPEVFISEGVDDYREAVRDVRNKLSYDYIGTSIQAMKNNVLRANIFEQQQLTDSSILNQHIKKWAKFVNKDFEDPINLLLRHLLQPQVVPTEMYSDINKGFQTYKTNDHLHKVVHRWAENNNSDLYDFNGKEFSRKLIQDIESFVDGSAEDPDMNWYERSVSDNYDVDALGKMVDPVRTLYNMGNYFSSPYLHMLNNKVVPRSFGKKVNLNTLSGEKVQARKHNRPPEWYKGKGGMMLDSNRRGAC